MRRTRALWAGNLLSLLAIFSLKTAAHNKSDDVHKSWAKAKLKKVQLCRTEGNWAHHHNRKPLFIRSSCPNVDEWSFNCTSLHCNMIKDVRVLRADAVTDVFRGCFIDFNRAVKQKVFILTLTPHNRLTTVWVLSDELVSDTLKRDQTFWNVSWEVV